MSPDRLPQQSPPPVSRNQGGVRVAREQLEIADTPAEHTVGLMYRRSMCDGCAMVFVFEDEQPRSFWMKNTYLSLDMIFVESDGMIATIHRSTIPLTTSGYASPYDIRYVIECPAGCADRFGLQEGDRIDMDYMLAS